MTASDGPLVPTETTVPGTALTRESYTDEEIRWLDLEHVFSSDIQSWQGLTLILQPPSSAESANDIPSPCRRWCCKCVGHDAAIAFSASLARRSTLEIDRSIDWWSLNLTPTLTKKEGSCYLATVSGVCLNSRPKRESGAARAYAGTAPQR